MVRYLSYVVLSICNSLYSLLLIVCFVNSLFRNHGEYISIYIEEILIWTFFLSSAWFSITHVLLKSKGNGTTSYKKKESCLCSSWKQCRAQMFHSLHTSSLLADVVFLTPRKTEKQRLLIRAPDWVLYVATNQNLPSKSWKVMSQWISNIINIILNSTWSSMKLWARFVSYFVLTSCQIFNTMR